MTPESASKRERGKLGSHRLSGKPNPGGRHKMPPQSTAIPTGRRASWIVTCGPGALLGLPSDMFMQIEKMQFSYLSIFPLNRWKTSFRPACFGRTPFFDHTNSLSSSRRNWRELWKDNVLFMKRLSEGRIHQGMDRVGLRCLKLAGVTA